MKEAQNGGHHQKGVSSFCAFFVSQNRCFARLSAGDSCGGARLKGEKAVKLNGRTVLLKQDQTLAEFLLAERFDGKTIAVELNGVIVARAEYETTRLTDEDSLEIVSFVGGG